MGRVKNTLVEFLRRRLATVGRKRALALIPVVAGRPSPPPARPGWRVDDHPRPGSVGQARRR